MVQEVRTIIFSETELQKALNAYRRMKPDFLPPGQIVYCKPDDNLIPIVNIEMKYGETIKEMEFPLLVDDFREMLIKFCIENNIMLPMKGKKAADFADGNAVLHVQLTTELG